MKTFRIISLILLIILFILGIETYIKFKKNSNKKIEEIRKPLLIRIDIIIGITIILAVIQLLMIIPIHGDKIISGVENYNKSYYLKEYCGDLDSTLAIFPNKDVDLTNSKFNSELRTALFDTDGFIVLETKYNDEDFNKEIERLKNINISIRSSYHKNTDVFINHIKYDETSYNLPAYIAMDGYDSTYEYALINENDKEIIYVYISYPDLDNKYYKDYLKIDKTDYSKTDTLSLFSIYSHSFDNGNTYMENDECDYIG